MVGSARSIRGGRTALAGFTGIICPSRPAKGPQGGCGNPAPRSGGEAATDHLVHDALNVHGPQLAEAEVLDHEQDLRLR